MNLAVKCRKCRYLLIQTDKHPVLDFHGDIVKVNNCITYDCGGNLVEAWYFQDDQLPEWMTTAFDEGSWSRGKIKCPNCNATLGSFDFVSGLKCTCSNKVKPPIHFTKSKVDIPIFLNT